jgi:hypothetical protein
MNAVAPRDAEAVTASHKDTCDAALRTVNDTEGPRLVCLMVGMVAGGLFASLWWALALFLFV